MNTKLYRGFELHIENEIDAYVIAMRGHNAVLWVDCGEEGYPQYRDGRWVPEQKDAIDIAISKIEMLIDAYSQDKSILERLPKEWQDGYKFADITTEQLKDAIARVLPVPGQLCLGCAA